MLDLGTMRVKTAYVVEENDKGKKVPRKIGQRPEQREGIEYEFSVVGEMDLDHTLTVTKTTCPALADAAIVRPGVELAETILAWIDSGEKLPDARDYRDEACDPATEYERLRAMYSEVKRRNLLGAPVVDEHGDETNLGQMLERLGFERRPKAEATG